MNRKWILTADKAKADLFAYKGMNSNPEKVTELKHKEGRLKAGEINTDAGGDRSDNSSAGIGAHSYDDGESAKEELKKDFARDIADTLEKFRSDNRFDSLIIAAEPTMLGELRNQMSSPMKDMIWAESVKNIAGRSGSEVLKHLRSAGLNL